MSDLEAPLVRPKRKKIWVDYFIQFRWIVVIFIVLPISATLYILTYLGDVWSETKSYEKRQKEHDQNVNKVIKRLKGRDAAKDGLVCTARKPWIAVGMRNVDYKRARHFEISRVTVPMTYPLLLSLFLRPLKVKPSETTTMKCMLSKTCLFLSTNWVMLSNGSTVKWRYYPLWLCPHKLFKQPVKSMISPEPGFEYEMRQGDTEDAQMYTDVGVYYAPGPVLRGEVFDGVEAVRKMEQWLIENHGYQPQYAVSELDERSFWRMLDADLYEHCRRKNKAIGTFMSIYYKSKKGRKTEKEVRLNHFVHK
ncbi:unnamed protein product [Brassica napus]|uniref:(rape) hypothetical protein n=1 Tax=Brassica napus TaxID=3708 RepID=A0A816Q0W1_BRANA|nr:unnamed protein product [Brassica napus]